jgi:alpha-D-ribose 1-methylphosphonate 5-triphosphate synthase subunit PhnH
MSPAAAGGMLIRQGFATPVFDAQAVFRAALVAISYPGRIVPAERPVPAPWPLTTTTAALCLTLMDFDTPAWLDRLAASGEVPAWLRFHCGAPLAEETRPARFAIVCDLANLPRLYSFHAGDEEYPDRSTTLILQVASLTDGPVTRWTGPGIKSSTEVAIAGLPDWFWSDWSLNGELYPRGIDVLFTCGTSLVGLPRSIQVEI